MSKPTQPLRSATFKSHQSSDGIITVSLGGWLDFNATGKIWREDLTAITIQRPKNLIVDASELVYCDGSGTGLLVELKHRQLTRGAQFELRGLAEEFLHIFNLFDTSESETKPRPISKSTSVIEKFGKGLLHIIKENVALVNYVGEFTLAIFWGLRNPKRLRWKDTFRLMEITGINAMPIITLIGFLMGVILAYQAAIPLKRFGAELFVAQLVSLSLLRELGPLMTAVILAGRSASAFAAELGTMKVNEEINALNTMGIDPMKFLILPRVIAAVLMSPFLCIYFILIGLVGGGMVIISLGFPLGTYLNQIQTSVTHLDLIGGLFKSFVFGILVIGIGCLRGLQTRNGASAVGDSTTSAVVSGIILIAIADGIFALVYYTLGI